MTLHQAASIVSIWAASKFQVRSVRFFGSRTSGKYHADSDIDVAVTLRYDDPDTALAYWFELKDQWHDELSSLLPWDVDLQFNHPAIDGIVNSSIQECSLRVFEGDG